ncbi:MAG: alanine racemase [Woeseiaceae bacterium]
MTFGARALIRLDALKHNLNVVRKSCPKAKIMAVVKANAYGHGMVPVARSIRGVDALAVARLAEAIELRDAGIETPIVLLAGVFNDEELQTAAAHNFEIVVHCPEQIELLEASKDLAATVWLKFDTGMNRLGFNPDDAAALVPRLQACDAVAELRLMSHLASADDRDNVATMAQLDQFNQLIQGFSGAVSIANSAGALAWPALAGECWIRPGIMLFGLSPFEDQTGADLGLKPVMQFEARLIATKPLPAGALVGYRGRYQAREQSTLGIVSAGYGDGYTRHFKSGTPVLINGRKVPLIGNVSMDMIAVDLGKNATDAVGDVATLWGDGLPIEEIAPWAEAIPYDLVCGVMNREASEIIDQVD